MRTGTDKRPKEMQLKIGRLIGVLIAGIVLTGNSCRALDAQQISFLADRDYFPEVKKYIDSARTSVHVMMFEASYYKKYARSPSNQLIRALADARKRGLIVDVVLEVSDRADRTTSRNLETARMLKQAGVSVTLDPETTTTHTKLVVIDRCTVILGSTNWTYSALTKNHELSTVLRSPEAAGYVLDYFEKVKRTGKKL